MDALTWATVVREDGRKLVKSVRLRASTMRDSGGWLSVDVKSAVERWIKKPRRNFGLEVVVRRRGRRRGFDTRNLIDGYDCCDADGNCE